MHTKTFSSEEKKILQEIAKSDDNVALAIIHLSTKSKTKEDKIKRVRAKDICVNALARVNEKV